ncbi:uncharacterized protein [Diadema antillarum]|uniref:uncharacterized protein n=1 Tax=Diadema antillarum TaxID=105358 RepID=UPI003A892E2F
MDMVRLYIIFFQTACFFVVSQSTVPGFSCDFGRRKFWGFINDLETCSIRSSEWIVASGYGPHGRQRNDNKGGGYFIAGAGGRANGAEFEIPQSALGRLSAGRLSFDFKIWQPNPSTLTVAVCGATHRITRSNSGWTGPKEINFYCSTPRITFRAKGTGKIAVDDVTITQIQGTTAPTTTKRQRQTTMIPRKATVTETRDVKHSSQSTTPHSRATAANGGSSGRPVRTETIGSAPEVTSRTESYQSTTSPDIRHLGRKGGAESSAIIATSLFLTVIFIIVLLAVHRRYRAAKLRGEVTSLSDFSNMGSPFRVIRNAYANWFHRNDANTSPGDNSQTAPTSNGRRSPPPRASQLYASVRKAPDWRLELHPDSVDRDPSERPGQQRWGCNGRDSTRSAEVEMVENELYKSHSFH